MRFGQTKARTNVVSETVDESLVAIADVAKALSGCTDVTSASRAALDAVRNAFGWAYGSCWLIDTRDRLLHCAVESGGAGEEFQRITRQATFAEGVGLSGRAWKARDLVVVEDLGTMTDCVRAPVAQKVGVRSGVCFPLIVNGQVLGTMDFFSTEILTTSPSRQAALRTVATLVSQTLEQLQVSANANELAAEASAVIGVLEAMSTATTSDEAVRAALATVRDAFSWEYGSYWRVDPRDQALKFAVESGEVGPRFREVTLGASFRLGVGLSGRAWKTRDLVFVEDLGTMTDCVRAPIAQQVGVRSGVCFPVIVRGEVVGTMDFFAMVTLDLSQTRLDTLRRVGRLVSQTIERLDAAEQAAIAAGQLIESIESISHTAARAVTATAAAVGRVVSAREAVSQLGDSTAEIGDVAQMITSIAKQTNLLALNATIEAARAGESGKGFAVVASEVKELAQQTGQATNDIQTRISAIQAGTVGAVDGIGAIATAVADVELVNRQIAEIIESQSAVTEAFLSRTGGRRWSDR